MRDAEYKYRIYDGKQNKMLAKRINPCLDCDFGVPGRRVVKGIEFKQIRYAGIPWGFAAEYDEQGADELVFLGIAASHE